MVKSNIGVDSTFSGNGSPDKRKKKMIQASGTSFNAAAAVTEQDKYEDTIIHLIGRLILLYPAKVEYELTKYGFVYPTNPTESDLATAVSNGLSDVKNGKAFATSIFNDIKDMERTNPSMSANGGYFQDAGVSPSTFNNILTGIGAVTNATTTIGSVFGGQAKAAGSPLGNQQTEDANQRLQDAINAQKITSTKKSNLPLILALSAGVVGVVIAVILIVKHANKPLSTQVAPA